jgi:pyruvate dehydrogenase E2 component (dihydrolipoamide acetyltransferase)
MPINILMPALSPTMTEGTLARWHKSEGDAVKAGDLLAEIETDKATMEVEAADEGTLGKIIVADGTLNVAVNSVIAVLLEEGETEKDIDLSSLEQPKKVEIEASAEPEKSAPTPAATPAPAVVSSNRPFASPLAKRIALDKNINLGSIQGSGPHGRIIKRDVESLGAGAMPQPTGPEFVDKPLSTMRTIIAGRLSESKQTIPHFYLTVDCAMDTVLAARKSLNETLADQGKKLTVNDFVLWACSRALRDNPDANVSWMGDKIRHYRDADIAIAVAIDGGLVTPIVRQSQVKDLVSLSGEVKTLVKKAHAGQLRPEEFQGGSFSISNLGMYGIQNFQAIINPPQACILAVGAVEERAVVEKGALVAKSVMTCTLSVDHRAIDGAVAAELLSSIKKYLENPWILLAKG